MVAPFDHSKLVLEVERLGLSCKPAAITDHDSNVECNSLVMAWIPPFANKSEDIVNSLRPSDAYMRR